MKPDILFQEEEFNQSTEEKTKIHCALVRAYLQIYKLSTSEHEPVNKLTKFEQLHLTY